MSALGQKRTSGRVRIMAALPRESGHWLTPCVGGSELARRIFTS